LDHLRCDGGQAVRGDGRDPRASHRTVHLHKTAERTREGPCRARRPDSGLACRADRARRHRLCKNSRTRKLYDPDLRLAVFDRRSAAAADILILAFACRRRANGQRLMRGYRPRLQYPNSHVRVTGVALRRKLSYVRSLLITAPLVFLYTGIMGSISV